MNREQVLKAASESDKDVISVETKSGAQYIVYDVSEQIRHSDAFMLVYGYRLNPKQGNRFSTRSRSSKSYDWFRLSNAKLIEDQQ